MLWELETILELRRGDLLFFPDHLLTHSNLKANGMRHSVVAFTEQGVWRWMQRAYGFVDERIMKEQDRRKRHRAYVKARQKHWPEVKNRELRGAIR